VRVEKAYEDERPREVDERDDEAAYPCRCSAGDRVLDDRGSRDLALGR
jgi:hypothetical protein